VKVFISWSGEKSRRVANVLRDWLPTVIQAVQPWLASADVASGARWEESFKSALSSSDAGILCITRSSVPSIWLQAGALIQSVGRERVILVLIDASPANLPSDLNEIQIINWNRMGIISLFHTLAALAYPDTPIELSERRLEEILMASRLAVEDISVGLDDSITATDSLTISRSEKRADEESLSAFGRKVDQLAAAIDLIKDRVIVGQAPGPSLQPVDVPSDKLPTMFIGSSMEGKDIAEAIQLELSDDVNSTLWRQDVFRPGQGFFETLVDRADEWDFAVIVMTADDVLIKRGIEYLAPRDNLIFEIGLFTGRLGRGRAFVVHPSDESKEFPSDFKGVNLIGFRMARPDNNLQAAVGPACTQIKRAMGIWNRKTSS